MNELHQAWTELLDALRPHWREALAFGLVMFVVLELVILTGWLLGLGEFAIAL